MIGQIVDQYKIAKALGKNAIAESFLATHTESGHLFLLKAVNPKLIALEGFKDQLIEDTIQVIKLDHPNVTPLSNVLDENNRVLTVQPFIEGKSLQEIIRGHAKGMSSREIGKIFLPGLAGLGYGHDEGYVHRLLAPKKIRVTGDGQIKVLDFGYVLQMAKEKYRKKDKLVPAAHYFSPERFTNPDTTDIRTNIYAMGIILFEMATGRKPFTAGSYTELQELHINGQFPDPRSFNPNTSEDLAAIIFKAVEKGTEDRFQDTEEFTEALKLELAASQDKAEESQDDINLSLEMALGNPPVPDVPGNLEESFNFGYEDISGDSPQEELDNPDPEANALDDDDPADDTNDFNEYSEDLATSTAGPETDFDTDKQIPPLDEDEDPPPGAPEVQFGPDNLSPSALDEAFDRELSKSEEDPFEWQEDSAEREEPSGFDLGDDASPQADGSFNFSDSGEFGQSPAQAPADSDDSGFNLDPPGDEPMEASFDFGATTDSSPEEEPFSLEDSSNDMDESFDFGVIAGGETPSEPFGFDGTDAPQSDTDPFSIDTPEGEDPGSDQFNFDVGESGRLDATASDGSDFDFGDDAPSQDASDPFAFEDTPVGGTEAESDPFSFDEQETPAVEADTGQNEDSFFNFQSGEQESEPPLATDEPQTTQEPQQDDPFDFGDSGSSDDPFNFDSEEDPFAQPEPEKDKSASPPVPPQDAQDPFADPGKWDDPTQAPAAPGPNTGSQPTDEPKRAPEPDATEDQTQAAATQADPGVDLDPPETAAKKGLEDSIAQLEKAKSSSKSKGKAIRPRVVRKLDKKILGLTVGLAAVVIIGMMVVINNNKQNSREEALYDQIRVLADQREYAQALNEIDRSRGDASSAFDKKLTQLQGDIERDKERTKKQVETLLERAQQYESEGKVLVDGKDDALGTYLEIVNWSPQHQEARDAASRIKNEQLKTADVYLQEGMELKALAIYANLTKADRSDQTVKEKYDGLKNTLNKERSTALKAQIETDYANRRYQAMVPKIEELDQIDPKSKFVREMRSNLVSAFDVRGEELLSRRKFDEAEQAFEYALTLDPKNAKIKQSLSAVTEAKLNYAIERKIRALEKAVTRKELSVQYQLANELNGMDPGNLTANSALDGVMEAIASMQQEAERERESGQFRKTAKLYKKIYDINGSEEVKALWAKYQQWSPPPKMSFIPIGTFEMGSQRTSSSRPVHKVTLSNYFIDQYEVTNGDFKKFVDANPPWRPARIDSQFHNGDYLSHWENGRPLPDQMNLPVTFVSWYAANAYAEWVGKRLPTEAEWERAAAGNTKEKKYWWGDYSDAKKAVYEFYPEKMPAEVGSYPKNQFEIFEILGNVNEWVTDTYNERYYRQTKDAKDPVNRSDGPSKVFRGGSFRSRGKDLAIYLRNHNEPRFCHETVGFRCAMDAKSELLD